MTRLKYERKQQRLSQQVLGDDAHINQPLISQIERLIFVPTPAMLDRLSRRLGVPACDLLKEVVVVERVEHAATPMAAPAPDAPASVRSEEGAA